MTTTSARVLVPTAITAAMLGAGTTLPEPATALGEVAWVSGATYTVGLSRTYSGSVYRCLIGHTGSAVSPNSDGTNWQRTGPTLRMAPFDDYTSTKAKGTGTLTYVINMPFVDGINVYGVDGSDYAITVKDAPGGAVIASKSGDLYEQAAGLWELAFAPLTRSDRIWLDGISISPTTEVTITVNNGASGAVAIGDIKMGGWRLIKGDAASFGGAQYGASSERKTYTSRTYAFDGTYTTVLRNSSRDIRCTVIVDVNAAMYADAIFAEIENIAVPFEATNVPNYGYLSTLGFVSFTMAADTPATTKIDLTIKGNI